MVNMGMVNGTKPHNVKWARIIVMVGLNFRCPAD